MCTNSRKNCLTCEQTATHGKTEAGSLNAYTEKCLLSWFCFVWLFVKEMVRTVNAAMNKHHKMSVGIVYTYIRQNKHHSEILQVYNTDLLYSHFILFIVLYTIHIETVKSVCVGTKCTYQILCLFYTLGVVLVVLHTQYSCTYHSIMILISAFMLDFYFEFEEYSTESCCSAIRFYDDKEQSVDFV